MSQSDSAADAPLTIAQTIPVTILTGFLGSGKTTLLNALLKHPAMGETAVLINELGDIGLDHMLVERVDDDVVLLDSGCLCCSVRSDLITSLRDLFLKRVRGLVPEFNRLVIETTGLADPAPILHTLMTDPLLSARYRLDGIVTTVDAVNAHSQLNRQPESVKQVAVSDRLVLTKGDLFPDADARRSLIDRLRQINPAASLIWAEHGQLDPAEILDAGLFSPKNKHPDVARWLREEAYREEEHHDHGHHDHGHHHHEHHEHHGHEHGHDCHDPDHCDHPDHHHALSRHDDQIRAYALTFDQPVDWDAFVTAMEILIASRGEDLLRVKGLLNVIDEPKPVVVHGVQHVFHPPAGLPEWPSEDRRSRVVFITRAIDRGLIAKLLTDTLGQAPSEG